jgi:hypothetical protein
MECPLPDLSEIAFDELVHVGLFAPYGLAEEPKNLGRSRAPWINRRTSIESALTL